MNLNYIPISLMCFILDFDKLVRSTGDFEVINLPMNWSSDNNATIPMSFTVFGKKVDLLLQKNINLSTRNFEVWKRDKDNNLSKIDRFSKPSSCHYIHQDSINTAAISLCDAGIMHGFVFSDTENLEIAPLSNNEESFESHRFKGRSSLSSSFEKPHVIYRRRIPSTSQSQLLDMQRIEVLSNRKKRSSDFENKYRDGDNVTSTLTIELAVFLDAAAYGLFLPRVAIDEDRLLELLLAYINNIQALYHHPSLGRHIDLRLVRLELMERQPEELAHLDGERAQLLDTFCGYSKANNPPGDEDPRHWDLALYLSGLDFYALEDGKRNPVTMGLAPVGGVCWPEYSCVIAEFGVSNRFGKPYPSAGFTSIYIAAHEIAHNLGMQHDSTGNDCPRDGYIMSPSRGTEGESQWSRCSRLVASSLATSKACLLDSSDEPVDHRLEHEGRFGSRPGRTWTAKHQCELLLRDREAVADSLEEICRALRCRSPSRTGIYLAGPALDGTKCNEMGAECTAGECLAREEEWEQIGEPTMTTSPGPRGWSAWIEGKCESGCIRGSLGYIERRRTCHDEEACPGLSFDGRLCKDGRICEKSQRKRLSIEEFAGKRCLEYKSHVADIDGAAGGLQASHEESRPWVACAVFCKTRNALSYYSPRLELNDLSIDPYFPDGTWCHKDERGENYFCRRHHCLPETFRFGKELLVEEEEEKLEKRLGPMNAGPWDWRPPLDLRRYFGLGLDGKPLLTNLGPRLLEDATPPKDGESWLDNKDYIELPLDFLLRHRQTHAVPV